MLQTLQQDVGRLDVAMYEPLSVCVVERLGHSSDQLSCLAVIQSLVLQMSG